MPIRRFAGVAIVCVGLVIPITGPAHAIPEQDPSPKKVVRASEKIRRAVQPENIEAHLRALEEIAKDNKGNRAVGTSGYEQSARYVEAILRKAGYRTNRQYFEYLHDEVTSTGLKVVSPDARTLEHSPMSYSPGTPAGGVTGALVTPKTPTGCSADEWGGVAAADKIALVRRGTCSFAVKSQAAKAAGATAIIIANNVDGPLSGTLGEPGDDYAPVTGITKAEGDKLFTATADGTVTVAFDLQKIVEKRKTFNVLAETRGGSADNVVMVGAHLDGVPDGPGINDNGSGSAAILEVAVQMAKQKKITNKVRFAWWGAEEIGLLGSENYVATMKRDNPEGLKKIATYLNFDMVGSPNHIIGVYDADQSTYEAPVKVPEGSAATEDVFTTYFDTIKQPWIDTEFSGRSDYQAFIEAGIPASGLFTGADGSKSKAEVMLFGGESGKPYDANYHTAADTLAHVNMRAVDVMSDAIAHTVYTLAHSTKPINGKG